MIVLFLGLLWWRLGMPGRPRREPTEPGDLTEKTEKTEMAPGDPEIAPPGPEA